MGRHGPFIGARSKKSARLLPVRFQRQRFHHTARIPRGQSIQGSERRRRRYNDAGLSGDTSGKPMIVSAPNTIRKHHQSGSAAEVLSAFAKLGVSCFGGPIAHIGYFRDEFVVRRRWLDERAYADLVCRLLLVQKHPSTQVGFCIGLMRAGALGAAAAWACFTLPSAILLVLFAYGAGFLHDPLGLGLLHGLKLVAVAIVAQAVWGMARTLCPDRRRASIAAIAAVIILFSGTSVAQIGAIVFGALAGLWLCRDEQVIQSG